MPWDQGELKTAWHHADDLVGLAIEKNLGTQHISVAVQTLLPHGITNHRDLLLLIVFLLCVVTAHQRLDFERGKHTTRHPSGIYLCRIADSGKFVTCRTNPTHALEAMRVARVIPDVGTGNSSLAGSAHVRALKNVI